jgi:hypothetical protein
MAVNFTESTGIPKPTKGKTNSRKPITYNVLFFIVHALAMAGNFITVRPAPNSN